MNEMRSKRPTSASPAARRLSISCHHSVHDVQRGRGRRYRRSPMEQDQVGRRRWLGRVGATAISLCTRARVVPHADRASERVGVAGGYCPEIAPEDTTRIAQPADETFVPARSPRQSCSAHSAVSGRVLVIVFRNYRRGCARQ